MTFKKIKGLIILTLFCASIVAIGYYIISMSLIIACIALEYVQVFPWEGVNVFLYIGIILFGLTYILAQFLNKIVFLPENEHQKN